MQRMLLVVAAISLCLFSLSPLPARADEAGDQRDVAKNFLTAYFNQNIPEARKSLPQNDASMFMQYPLAADPVFSQPKVHKKQALLEFTAKMADTKFPAKGGIIFFRQNNVWKVRQVLFYNRIPALFGLPSKSVTADDRGQEAKVRALGESFMGSWKTNDRKAMLANWCDWANRNEDIVKGLKISDFKLSNSTTTWKDPYVTFSVKLAYRVGPLTYQMTVTGGVILVKEDGKWKVRGNSFVIDF